MKKQPIEVCEAMKTVSRNYIFRLFKEYLESKLPNFAHECPYKTVEL